jgi:hypothetical protein
VETCRVAVGVSLGVALEMMGVSVGAGVGGREKFVGVLVKGGNGVGPGGVDVGIVAGSGRTQLANTRDRISDEIRTEPNLERGDKHLRDMDHSSFMTNHT